MKSGGDPVDGQLDESEEAVAFGIGRRAGAEAGEQHHLEGGQRVDVRVAQPDPTPQLRLVFEQLVATGQPGQPGDGPAMLRLDRCPAAGMVVAMG